MTRHLLAIDDVEDDVADTVVSLVVVLTSLFIEGVRGIPVSVDDDDLVTISSASIELSLSLNLSVIVTLSSLLLRPQVPTDQLVAQMSNSEGIQPLTIRSRSLPVVKVQPARK